MASKPSLTIKRRLAAPAETVYAAWTRPEQMSQWWGEVQTPKAPIAETDVRAGGRFRVQFWGKNGEHHSVSGVYREVVPNRRLVFSWAFQSTPERESQVTIDLAPAGEGTLLTLTHEQFFDETARDNHARGWNIFLDNLERALA